MSTTTRLFRTVGALALLVGFAPAWAEVEFIPFGPDKPPARQKKGPSAEKQLQAERQRTADLERQLREAKAANKDKKPLEAPNQNDAAAPQEIDGFIILPGGVARDKASGLAWMRCSLGQTWDGQTCQGKAKEFTFEQAQEAAKALNARGGYAGKTDWRVPTVRELLGLVYCSKGIGKYTTDVNDGGAPLKSGCLSDDSARPTLRTQVFPNTGSTWYWSASPYAGNAGFAWVVDFGNGGVGLNRYNSFQVRLVRASQ